MTDQFFARHPDWVARYGERGRARGIEDAGFHLDFLAGAIEAGAPAAFEEYVRWAARVLYARGRQIWRYLTEDDAAMLRQKIEAGERRPEDRFLLNLSAGTMPYTLECHLDLLPDGFVLIGELPATQEHALEQLFQLEVLITHSNSCVQAELAG